MNMTKPAPGRRALPMQDWRLLKRRPKAHWLSGESSVLVTGTLDIELAAQFIEATEPDMLKFIQSDGVNPRPERGNIIPQHPEAEYRWLWMASNAGRSSAVLWER